MDRLVDKVVLVTGAGRGYGKYLSMGLASEGANLVAASRSTPELEALKKSIEERGGGGDCILFPTDLLKMEDMVRLRDFIDSKYGRLDSLVNCAADNLWKLFEETTIEEWDRSISINLRAPFVLSKLFLPMMKRRGRGNIINVSSGSATRGFVAETAYCPSKYGLEGLTQCLAMELYQYNVAVNSLSVSAPEGKRLKPSRLTTADEDKLSEDARAKFASDDEMVEAFSEAWSFLALQDAHGVTGQRFGPRQLAEYLRVNGWEAAQANWRDKLTMAVYVSYDLPDKVHYDTMLKDKIGDAGMKVMHFKK